MPKPKPRPPDRPRIAHSKPRRTIAAAAAPYHHGDLRRALLDATEDVLASDGLEGFTLREVARRAGVSHGAPAHHFGDVRGLLSAFTAQSFEDMAASMRRHRARVAPDGFDQLAAVGTAYVEYALAHRARFQLMFRSDRLDSSHAALESAACESYGHLTECIARVAQQIGAPDYAIQEKIALAWSMVHGYATLLIDNENFATRMAGGSDDRALDLFESMLRLSRAAFTVHGR